LDIAIKELQRDLIRSYKEGDREEGERVLNRDKDRKKLAGWKSIWKERDKKGEMKGKIHNILKKNGRLKNIYNSCENDFYFVNLLI
jgi:hypothetical protein